MKTTASRYGPVTPDSNEMTITEKMTTFAKKAYEVAKTTLHTLMRAITPQPQLGFAGAARTVGHGVSIDTTAGTTNPYAAVFRRHKSGRPDGTDNTTTGMNTKNRHGGNTNGDNGILQRHALQV